MFGTKSGIIRQAQKEEGGKEAQFLPAPHYG